ncbi:MAG: glycosyltransferase family 4 protein [Acidobacteriota bacterium]
MKICLVGGIYQKGGARNQKLKITPETTLEEGFKAAGHAVTTLSHYDPIPAEQFDLVHVHHLSFGATRAACDATTTPFAFTAHFAGQMDGAVVPTHRRIAMDYVLSRADGIVSLAENEAAYQREHNSIDGAVQATIANGINPDVYTYERKNIAGRDGRWRILFAAQLIPIKKCDLLLRAVALLPFDIEVSLAYHNQSVEQELRDLAAQLGIAGRVNFLGKHRPEQLAERFHSNDLLVLPSQTESLPSVVTEAMLCGLPFVARTVGGVVDQAGGYGVLFEQAEPGVLAAAIRKMIENYPMHAARTREMSDYARNKFTIQAMVSRHLAFYEKLVGKRARRRDVGLPGVDAAMRIAMRVVGQNPPAKSVRPNVAPVLDAGGSR